MEPLSAFRAFLWGLGGVKFAARRLRPLAEHGDQLAQFELGRCYIAGGKAFRRDYVQGYKWMALAASRDTHAGDRFSEEIKQDAEGFIHGQKGVPGLEERMNCADLQRAKELIAEWRSQS